MLTFNEDRHEYRWNGQVVPSVTQILSPLVDYSKVHPEVLKDAQELGTMVHKTTELHDMGLLDEEDLDPILVPYLNAWKKFRQECAFVPATVEERHYHPALAYCGTWDRTGFVRGRMAVVDIKKMLTLGPVIGVQLAAYQAMHNLDTTRPPVVDRYALGLRANGTYRLQPYEDPTDLACFMALLTQHKAQATISNWRIRNDHHN